jgi:hypothetical protein
VATQDIYQKKEKGNARKGKHAAVLQRNLQVMLHPLRQLLRATLTP